MVACLVEYDCSEGLVGSAGQTDVLRRPLRATPGVSYLPALDGLRAVAVVAVVGYHLGLDFLPGGFLGVDLFFVISGFLITMLLTIQAENTGRVRIGAFWLRRARRLLPALVVLVVAVCAAAVLIGHELTAGLRLQVFGAAVYGSNWMQIASGSSYVQHEQPSLFTHLWSLAVEEQFYLLWPFVVVLLLSFADRRRTRVLVVLALALASALWMAWVFVPGTDPTRAYVGTDTHGFPLLLGAALGLGLPIPPARGAVGHPLRSAGWWPWLGVAGAGAVLAGMLLLTDSGAASFWGGIFLVDLFAVLLVGAAALGVGPVGGIFALPVLRWVGCRSYGIYLWHWPVIVILGRLAPGSAGSWPAVVAAVAVTGAAAEVSWRLVECPIRRFGFGQWCRQLRQALSRTAVSPQRRRPPVIAVSAFAVAFAVAAVGIASAPARSIVDEQLAAGQQAIARHQAAAQRPPAPPQTLVPPRTLVPPPTPAPGAATPTVPAGRHAAVPAAPVHTDQPPRASAGTGAAVSADGPVFAIGDSLMVGAAPDLYHDFPAIDIDAVVGRQWWNAPAVLAGRLAAGPVPPVVIIGLGTNGSWSTGSIQDALRPLGNRTVVLVSSYVAKPWEQPGNAAVAAVAAGRPHTCVADWYNLAKAHPRWIGPDGVHPLSPGRQAYADLLRRTVASCT